MSGPMEGVDLKERLVNAAKRHPRVEYQKLLAGPEAMAPVLAAMPAFIPFDQKKYAGAFWVLDWDHKLPSKQVMLRLYAYYDLARMAAAEQSYAAKAESIARQELFPEFDVPDFSGIEADESYETEFEIKGEPPTKYRLMSTWRHTVVPTVGRRAEELVRDSAEYKVLRDAVKERPMGLGGPEAAQWVSPAETGHNAWAVEVWFLRNFNGMVGEGTAFVVDTTSGKIVGQRDFQFRAG